MASAWGRPVPLFEADGKYVFSNDLLRMFDVAPDGRFLMIKEDATEEASTPQDQIILILNWLQELAGRVPLERFSKSSSTR